MRPIREVNQKRVSLVGLENKFGDVFFTKSLSDAHVAEYINVHKDFAICSESNYRIDRFAIIGLACRQIHNSYPRAKGRFLIVNFRFAPVNITGNQSVELTTWNSRQSRSITKFREELF